MKKNYLIVLSGIVVLMQLVGITSPTHVKAEGLEPISTLIDKTQASGNLPAIIDNAGNNRGAGFNKDYVFVASRQNGNHVYYWSISNPAADPMELDLTGVSGGTFTLADLTVVGNHIFASNMVFVGGEFRVYHWNGISSQPSVLLSFSNAPARLGDAFSVLGNPETQAKLIASGHGTQNFYVWNIVNGQIPNATPTVYTFSGILNANFGRMTQVPGEPELYLASGSGFGLLLLDSQMNILADVAAGFFPYWSMYPYIFYYQGQRFLAYQHVKSPPAENVMYILDLNPGATVAEALEIMEQSTFAEKVVHSVNLGSNANGNASVSLDVLNDAAGNIYVLAYSAGNGFIVQKYGDATGTGISQPGLIQSIIYPNPAKSTFQIKSDQKIMQVVIYDIAGRESLSIRVEAHHLNLNAADFNNGLYFVRIYTDSGVSVQKLLIQK